VYLELWSQLALFSLFNIFLFSALGVLVASLGAMIAPDLALSVPLAASRLLKFLGDHLAGLTLVAIFAGLVWILEKIEKARNSVFSGGQYGVSRARFSQ
jgi:hypothetical protein